MIKYYSDIIQGTDEWFALREGKLTASHATAIGANSKGLETYCLDIVTELYQKEKPEFYTNKDIERGNELESLAVFSYEMETKNKVYQVGFVENDKYANVGASPDGLIGLDGGLEIKARNDAKHMSLLLGKGKSEIPYNQIQMCLLITERKWWDFVSINTNFDKHLFIQRIYPDLDYFEKLKKGFEKGNNLIDEYIKKYNNYKL